MGDRGGHGRTHIGYVDGIDIDKVRDTSDGDMPVTCTGFTVTLIHLEGFNGTRDGMGMSRPCHDGCDDRECYEAHTEGDPKREGATHNATDLCREAGSVLAEQAVPWRQQLHTEGTPEKEEDTGDQYQDHQHAWGLEGNARNLR